MKAWEKSLLIFPIIFYAMGSGFYLSQPIVCDSYDVCITGIEGFGALTENFILFYGIPATGYLIYRKIKQKKKEKVSSPVS